MDARTPKGSDGVVRRLVLLLARSSVVLVAAGCALGSGDDGGSARPDAAPVVVGEARSGSDEQASPEHDARPRAQQPASVVDTDLASLVATAVVADVEVFDSPGATTPPTHVLAHPTPRGAPRVFLVEEQADDWLQVLLPVRPNGSTGWIRASDVTLARNPYRIAVDLAAFELTIEQHGEVVLTTPIGFGAAETPTPGGRYYLIELLQPPDPTGAYGPFAYGLSGFSDVHLDFAGGEGVIGIHGTDAPDTIGTTVSNGCIRVDNEVITHMATFLPLGTPVTIS